MNFIQTHVRTLYGLLFCVLLPAFSQAQIMFERHYGGSGDEYGSTCIQTNDGGYIVTGSTDSYGLGGRDIYVIRTDEYGNVLWSKTYGGTGDDQSTCIIQAFDENFVVSGISNSLDAGNRDVYCIKLDQNGDTIWTKTYGTPGSDNCYSIIQCSDSGLLLTGDTPNIQSGYLDTYCVKTNYLGDTLWTKAFMKKNFNTGVSVTPTNDGGYLVATITSTYGVSNSHDGFIISLNDWGDTIWTKTFDKGLDDWVSSIVELSAGDIVVSGTTNSSGHGGYDVFLARFNSQGDEIWFKNYGGTEDDLGGRIIITDDSGIVLSGSTYSFGQGANDVYLIKTNLNGDTLWTKTYGGYANDNGGSIMQTSDGGLIIGGSSSSFGNASEIYLIKTNANGFAGIEQNCRHSNEIKIYPNPTNGLFTIEKGNNEASSSSLRIFDLVGRLVYYRPEIFQSSMAENIEVPYLSPGAYYLVISNEYHIATTRLTIAK